jgi:hypothetical protein
LVDAACKSLFPRVSFERRLRSFVELSVENVLMPLRRRHRRWIALIALFGLLFQQLAMAAYVCPLERDGVASVAATSAMPPCRSPDTTDKARCQQHCHPVAQTSDHATPPTVPAALLSATTWSREARTIRIDLPESIACEVDAHATAPPLTIQHCTFQI